MRIVAKPLVLEFGVFSDPCISMAFWLGTVASVIAGVLLLRVLHMRWRLLTHGLRRKQFRENTKFLIIRLLAGEPVTLPVISTRDLPDFLTVWLHFQTLLRGDSQLLLNQVLRSSGLQPAIRQLLLSSRLEEKLVAATTMRHCGDALAWDSLMVLLRDHSPLVSMTALRALVAIDAEQAAVIAIPLITEYRDWPPVALALLLKQAKPDLQQVLLFHVEQYLLESPLYLPRLLNLLTVLPQNKPLPLIGKLISASDLEPEILSICLRLVNHPADLSWVRSCFGDQRSYVQVQIAGVLARMGAPQDAHYLLFLLNSENWWVRYRAAQALLQQPLIKPKVVKRLINNRSDIFARDMLLQILAENRRC